MDNKREKIKVAFFDAKPYDIESFKQNNPHDYIDFRFFDYHLTEETAEITRGYDAVCIFVNDQVNKNIARSLKDNGVKLITVRAAGYNNIDLEAVFEKINVTRVPAYSPYAVAEHIAALILSLNRKIHKAYYRTRDNNFNINGLLGFDLHGKTAGIIGTGKIGSILCRILHGFGMKLIAFDKYPKQELSEKYDLQYVEKEELLRQADIISLNCPLTEETVHLIDKTAIAQMKDGVMIINAGRGQLIDTPALIDGLKTKKIGSAGLDVYEEESEYFFEDFSDSFIDDDVLARLISFSNVLITSHQGFFTREALRNIAETTCQNIDDFFQDRVLKNEVCYRCDHDPCKKDENFKRCF